MHAAQLMPETLFLTTNLIDRFLECKRVSRRNLQLVRASHPPLHVLCATVLHPLKPCSSSNAKAASRYCCALLGLEVCGVHAALGGTNDESA
jgi:hypothetical protein